jgi:hypothetical protein
MRVYTACDYAQNAGRSKFSLILGHRPPRTELTFKLFAMDTLALLSSGGHRRGHTYTHTQPVRQCAVRSLESTPACHTEYCCMLQTKVGSHQQDILSLVRLFVVLDRLAPAYGCPQPQSQRIIKHCARLRPSAPAQPCGGRTLSPSPGPGRKGPASPPPQDPRRGGPLASSQHSPWVSIRCTSLASASLRCSTGSSHHRSCRLHFIAADPGPGSSHPSCLGPVQPSRRRCGSESDTVRRLTWKYYFQGNNS